MSIFATRLPKGVSFVFFLNLCFTVLFAAEPGLDLPDQGNVVRYRSDRIIIKPKGATALKGMNDLHLRRGYRVLKSFPALDRIQVLAIPSGVSVEEAIADYEQSGLVEFAEPDYMVRAYSVPNDPRYRDGSQWGLNNTGNSGGVAGADIAALGAWNVLSAVSNVVVAVVDTGVRYTHEDLADNMWVNPNEVPGNGVDDDNNGFIDDVHGIDALNNTGNPSDTVGHGTHVAGILGAVGDNGKGGTGVAWKVKIMACRFMDEEGFGSNADAVQCIDYARTHGAQIINASWGSGGNSSALRSAISRARSEGIIIVAAAGNESLDTDASANYPSGYDLDNIVSVASVTRSDGLSDFSNFGALTVDVAAPGTAIFSSWISSDQSYAYHSGTSMAAPFVTGALALMRAHFPDETHTQIINRVLAAAEPVAALSGKCLTGGRLNLRRALAENLLANFTMSRVVGPAPLSISFKDSSVGEIGSRTWDFGDGTPGSSEANPTHVFETDGTYTVSLSVVGEGGVTNIKSRTISVLSNYQIASTNYQWIEATNMTKISLTDNGVSPAQKLPFSFVYYGQVYDQIYVGANGIIGFVNQRLTTTSNGDLPSGATPNAIICPYWDNLNPTAGGSIHFGVIGEEPNRQAVISWLKVPRNSTPDAALTFQAVLEENSNNVLFQYQDIQPSTSRGAGRGATIGLENETGQIAAKYIYNGSPRLLTNNQAILFTSRSSPGIVVTPAGNASFTIGQNQATSVPTYAIENRGSATIEWTASKTQHWLELSATNGFLAPNTKTNIEVRLSASAQSLPSGSYSDLIYFRNNPSGKGNAVRAVQLEVGGAAGILTITPDTAFTSSGLVGGPFSPLSQVYTLINTGAGRLEWTAETDRTWLALSTQGGSLAAGASTTVTVSLDGEETPDLSAGSYFGRISFSNTSGGTVTEHRNAVLEVRLPGQSKLTLVSQVLDNTLRLRLNGEPGRAYVIQTSANLSQWSSISTNTANEKGTFEIVDPQGRNRPRTFYRALTR